MIKAPIPVDEPARLKTLYSYEIHDNEDELSFNEVTEFVAEICKVPIASITLMDEKREWCKSKTGISDMEASLNLKKRK